MRSEHYLPPRQGILSGGQDTSPPDRMPQGGDMVPGWDMAPARGATTILDSTLREGEQFAGAFFSFEQQLAIARLLDAIGITFIEVPSPIASPETRRTVHTACELGQRAKIVAHVRCAEADVQAALDTPVSGLNLFYGTSAELRTFSHGRRIDQILDDAVPLIRRIRSAGRYVRFSAEDAFRSDLVDLLTVFDAVVDAGVQRIGLPDTTGIATPRQVEQLVLLCAQRYPHSGIEFHGHNDTGCAIANTVAALEAGADCLDVTVLGIGERNGIASLSGLIAQLYLHHPELLAAYDLTQLAPLDHFVAECLNLTIPFNMPITAPGAFTHRAGVHTKAVLRNPRSYEVLDPGDFGLMRHIDIGSRFTGRYAVGQRAATLGLHLSDDEVFHLTQALKARAEQGSLSQEEVDAFIHTWYQEKGNLIWER
jgi:homocitrate synthase